MFNVEHVERAYSETVFDLFKGFILMNLAQEDLETNPITMFYKFFSIPRLTRTRLLFFFL
jgi:hypothetical protein